ncbi:hypothetical protein PGT21_025384 [Puccinia graminis f. sp. tritici]|uniref:Uncharacterized protein n=1 Tax=Puccinia graminis f. sp. tritici TaxID=56615 RepID=A0A5B0MFP5_PUCGR|nr:hypothetical protein PGT21_025384 [Puccinia graminis f. sp. tritici]
MRTRQLPDLLSFLDEYPLTKKYSKREIGPLVLVVSTLILTGLCIFNVFTQGKAEKIESFLSTRFLDNSTNGKGDHVTCQPTLLKVDDNFFMVIPPDENETLTASVEDLQIAAHSNMSFKWTLVDIGDESGTGSRKVSSGFLYRGERTNCSVNFVKSTYQFQDTNYQYVVCGTCLIGNKLKAKLCNSLNAAADDLLRGSSGRFWTSSAHVYRSFDGYDPRLSIPLHTLPLSAFPPNYTEVQEDYYRSFKPTIGPRDITELGTWLGGVKLIPASQLSGYDVEFPWRTLPPPQGNIFVDNSTEPSDFFSAFNTTYHALCQGHECSNFRITVNGIGALGPFGFKDSKLFKIPEVLMDMFNRSLSYDVRIMDLAANDLHGKEIGATYLCTKTTKKWLPLLKVISVTLGSSSGLFSGIFSLLVDTISIMKIAETAKQRKRGWMNQLSIAKTTKIHLLGPKIYSSRWEKFFDTFFQYVLIRHFCEFNGKKCRAKNIPGSGETILLRFFILSSRFKDTHTYQIFCAGFLSQHDSDLKFILWLEYEFHFDL